MKLKQFFLFFHFSFFIVLANAQVDLLFMDHLSKNNLEKEQLAYIHELSGKVSSDTLSYLKAKYYLQYYNDSLFFSNYSASKKIFINDTLTFNKANIFFLNPVVTGQSKWFGSLENEKTSYLSKNISFVYSTGLSPLKCDANTLPVVLQKDFLKYKKSYNKKPFIGGALSAVIPGKKRSFVTTFLANVVYGIQSYESIDKLGIKNPFSIFTLSFFSVFYIANIYGSYHDVAQVKKDTKKQYLINAFNYYNFNYSY